jgi:hypothetical protein
MSKLSWTPEQDEALKEAIAEGVSLQRLAVRFKRPAAALSNRARFLGIQIKKVQRLTAAERDLATRPRKQ